MRINSAVLVQLLLRYPIPFVLIFASVKAQYIIPKYKSATQEKPNSDSIAGLKNTFKI